MLTATAEQIWLGEELNLTVHCFSNILERNSIEAGLDIFTQLAIFFSNRKGGFHYDQILS